MIEDFINNSLRQYPANKDDIFISLVGHGLILKIVFATGLVLDFRMPDKITIPNYSQVKESIADDFIDFDILKKLYTEKHIEWTEKFPKMVRMDQPKKQEEDYIEI